MNKTKIRDCVYYFFNDKNEKLKNEINPKKKLTKIIHLDFYMHNEVSVSKKIKEITNFKRHFYLFDTFEYTKIAKLYNDSHYLRSAKELDGDMSALVKFEDRQLIYLNNYLKPLSSSKKYIFKIIEFYKYLLASIDLLVGSQLVHNYISFHTIQVDYFEQPLLSNFSFSLDVGRPDIEEYIKHFFVEYKPDYLEWPLEFHIVAYLLTNKLESLSAYNIETIVHDVIENHAILKNFGKDIITNFKEDGIKYFNKYVNQSYEIIIKDVLKYYYTWDNYQLSTYYLKIIIGMHRSLKKQNKFVIDFMKLLVSNIHTNPLKRLSIEATTNKFELVIENTELDEFKYLIHAL
jgi:hypothetical protein